MDDRYYMQMVLDKARESLHTGESPFAAGIVLDGRLVVLEGNRTKSGKDPLLHAETAAIHAFCKSYPQEALGRAALYSSCEPCMMCFGAVCNACIPRLVYGAAIEDAIRYGSGDFPAPTVKLAEQYGLKLEIIGGVLREQAAGLFEEYLRIYQEM